MLNVWCRGREWLLTNRSRETQVGRASGFHWGPGVSCSVRRPLEFHLPLLPSGGHVLSQHPKDKSKQTHCQVAASTHAIPFLAPFSPLHCPASCTPIPSVPRGLPSPKCHFLQKPIRNTCSPNSLEISRGCSDLQVWTVELSFSRERLF